MRRPAQLEGPERSLCHTRQHGPPKSQSISGTRCRKECVVNLTNALKLLANQQKDGDSPFGTATSRTRLARAPRKRAISSISTMTALLLRPRHLMISRCLHRNASPNRRPGRRRATTSNLEKRFEESTGGRVVTSGQFLKKGLPGRVDTSGTKNYD